MTLHGKSLIAGRLSQHHTRGFKPVSPLDNKPLEPEFHECALEEVDRALLHAEEAFPICRGIAPEARATFLETIAEEILALGDELPQRAHRETGLPLDRLAGERARTVNQLRLFAEVVREGSWVDARIDTALPDRLPVPRPDLRRMLVPLGPVAVFGSSNFPLAFSVSGGDTASALAAGNPVIVKAHRGHPGTSEFVAGAVARAAIRCSFPDGVFSMLHGAGHAIGVALVRHPLTRAAGFTGSRVAGRALFDAAAGRPEPIPVFAEMSSLNPLFLLPGALRERRAQIVEGLKTSVNMGVGQFCTKPGLVFGLGGPDFEAFASEFARAMASVPPGTMLHAGICEAYHESLERMEKIPGVISLGMSDREPERDKTHGEAVVFATDAESFLQNRELHEEVFGPYTLLVTARSWGELETAARHLEGQLTATLHAQPEELGAAADLLALLERKAGRVVVNGFPTGVEVCASMNHGGPYPATTDVRFTSVGTAAMQRFVRPVCFQNFPGDVLPPELQNENPRRLMRLVNGQLTRESL
ncbi:MAG: aldehyde dehydrogenase (NADP(+)) [Verrucomicrobiota bacterium]|nr:aldehyde dehydrogenase (NADP(+)) [Verrucomicrobiota bacterium]